MCLLMSANAALSHEDNSVQWTDHSLSPLLRICAIGGLGHRVSVMQVTVVLSTNQGSESLNEICTTTSDLCLNMSHFHHDTI